MSPDEDEEEPEERLTADSYGSLDVSEVNDECWLVRIPPKLSQAWEVLPEGTELGELVFTKGGVPGSSNNSNNNVKPSVRIHVSEHVAENYREIQQKLAPPTAREAGMATSNALPLNYSLQAMTKKIPLLIPFARNPRTGTVKLWGTVSRTANLQVEKDDQYRAMLKDRLVTTNINNHRYVKPVEATESVLSKQRPTVATTISNVVSGPRKKSFGEAVLLFGKRKLEAAETNAMAQRQPTTSNSNTNANGKKSRQFAPDQPMRSVIFELFAQSPFWAVKDLKAAAVAGGAVHAGTGKGEKEIRDILREIGEYHRSGDHKNMWELRQEFQQQN